MSGYIIANKITSSCIGVDSSKDCNRVDCVLVEALVDQLLVSLLTLVANKIASSCSGVDSSQDCSLVDCVQVETSLVSLLT